MQQGGPPEARRSASALNAVHAFLVSPKLAIALLVVVLACCLVGVTVVHGERAGQLIFGTLWFNALLVLLAISSAVTFFSRIWKRKLTLLSVGMIAFHVSFAALLGGIVYHRMFYFDGLLRLTEGETLPNGRLESYDRIDMGRFFTPDRLKGETTLVRMHVDYKVDGKNKRAAYELALSDGEAVAHQTIWITEYLDFRGTRFFCQKEGYSVLLVMKDKQGREIYGAHVPLQSLEQKENKFVYVSGTPRGIAPFPFPPPPDQPRAEVAMLYRPSEVAQRQGEVTFSVLPLDAKGEVAGEEREGRAVVGAWWDAGDFVLAPQEIRYWVGINVRHDPGMTVILGSLVIGALGMSLVMIARIRQGARKHGVAST